MKHYDVAVLGSGPSGLTAAYRLGQRGLKVVVLERAAQPGGLMRGVQIGDCRLDLGRKELYSRFHEVHELWSELLGKDYREYQHRVGVLYHGRVLEKSAAFQGRSRGLSPGQILHLAGSYLARQLRPGSRRADTVEQYYLLRFGKAYYDYFVHGFNLKFDGQSPATVPNREGDAVVPRFGFLRRKRGKTGAKADVLFHGQQQWRHPALGTQQIVDELVRRSKGDGVEFVFGADVSRIQVQPDQEHVLTFGDGLDVRQITARSIVSSTPLPVLTGLLDPPLATLGEPPQEEVLFRKQTSLVYLLADGPPRFPHNWIEVTDRRLKMGRVVNYATWNGRMVPEGKTALCVEFFQLEGDPVVAMSKDELYRLTLQEIAEAGLLDPKSVTDYLVLQLPKVNASTVIFDRKQAWLEAAAEAVEALPRFYETNRPGMDRATLAGIDAAKACSGSEVMSRRSLAVSSSEL